MWHVGSAARLASLGMIWALLTRQPHGQLLRCVALAGVLDSLLTWDLSTA